MIWTRKPIRSGGTLPEEVFFDYVTDKNERNYPGLFYCFGGDGIGDQHPKIRPNELSLVRGEPPNDEYLFHGHWKKLGRLSPKRPFGKCAGIGADPYSWPDCEDETDDVKEYEDDPPVEEDLRECEDTPKKVDEVDGAPARVPGRFGYILGTSS